MEVPSPIGYKITCICGKCDVIEDNKFAEELRSCKTIEEMGITIAKYINANRQKNFILKLNNEDKKCCEKK